MSHYSDQREKDALEQLEIYKLVADAKKDEARLKSLGEAYIEETDASTPVLILNALQTPDGTKNILTRMEKRIWLMAD